MQLPKVERKVIGNVFIGRGKLVVGDPRDLDSGADPVPQNGLFERLKARMNNGETYSTGVVLSRGPGTNLYKCRDSECRRNRANRENGIEFIRKAALASRKEEPLVGKAQSPEGSEPVSHDDEGKSPA
jgi:hypothetical protein